VSRRERITKELIVEPGTEANIAGRDPGWTGGPEFEELSARQLSRTAKALLAGGVQELAKAQELLWASDTNALLVVFQALDAAGKDSTIKHVMSGVNPQGVQVVSFKQPSSEELDHDFLWRTSKALPERGRIGIFNRSHYEEVVALRVHPEWLQKQKLPPGPRGTSFWAERHEDINAFERHLDRNGTKIVKFFLHVSKREQKRRFLARLDEPGKQWKFSAADLAERAHGRVHAGVRGGDHGHVHTLGALVRDPRRPQAGHAGDGRRHPGRHDRLAGPELAGGLGAGPGSQRRGPAQPRGRAGGCAKRTVMPSKRHEHDRACRSERADGGCAALIVGLLLGRPASTSGPAPVPWRCSGRRPEDPTQRRQP
jgi:PPK2 family polyphosphate:nucleotide phosphotransferase